MKSHNLKFFCRKTIASIIQPSVEGNKENKKPTEVAIGDVAAHETGETISNWLSLEEEISCDVDLTDSYF